MTRGRSGTALPPAPPDVEPGRSAALVAELDVASVPGDSPGNAAATVVISTLLYEPVLLALRRLAQEAASADRFGLDAGPPGR